MKKLFISVLMTFILMGTVFLSGCTINTYENYSNQYMSFQYPNGWHTEDNAVGGVNVFEDPSQNTTDQNRFTVVPYGTNFILTFNDFKDDIATKTSGKNIKTSVINGVKYNYTEKTSNDAKSWHTYYFVKNGKGVIIQSYIKNPAVIEKVISTFN